MLLGEMIAVALQSLRSNLFRAFLTMLGIIIGVGSVITMVAMGAGAQQAIDKQIDSLGADLLTVRARAGRHRGVATTGVTLNIKDAVALAGGPDSISAVVPEMSQNFQVKLNNKNQNLRVTAASSNYADIHSYKLLLGRMYDKVDNSAKRRVAIIGGAVPEMFKTTAEDMLGKTVFISGVAFEIIGAFEEKGTQGWRNPDQQLWIPLNTGRYRVMGKETLDNISVRVAKGVSTTLASIDIERILRREHRLQPGANNNFQIEDRKQFLNVRQEAANVFSFLLAGIASVSLIVGGIGIMNIMLVTVTERTREIGIRKALGATRSNILMQFLVEAVILCMIGGITGILIGTGAATLISNLAGWQTYVSPTAILIAFGFSVGTGLLFGILPARKAAMLDPIEALRYE